MGKYSRPVEDLVQNIGFGLTSGEIRRYMREVYNFQTGQVDCARAAYRKYATEPEWDTYASRLLQKTGVSVFAGGKCYRAASRTGVLRTDVAQGQKIFAKNQTEALGRVLFEISQSFDEMYSREDVSKLCGYRILSYLRDKTEPVSIKEMVKTFGRSTNHIAALKVRTIDPLIELGLLHRTDGHISPTLLLSSAFDLTDEKRNDILEFPQARRWFYPFEIRKNVAAAST